MEPGFFQSREFVVAAAVAALVVVAGLAVAGTAPAAFGNNACFVQQPAGAPTPGDVDEHPPQRRGADAVAEATLAWTLGANETLLLRMCTEVGAIRVVPADDDRLLVEATMRLEGGDPESLHMGPLRWKAVRDDAGLRLSVHHQDMPERVGFFESTVARMSYVVHVPTAHGAADLDLEVEVGGIEVTGLDADSLRLMVDVGSVALSAVRVTGPTTIETDVGDVRGDLRTGALDIQTDVGDVDLDVVAERSAQWTVSTDVGDIDLRTLGNGTFGYDVSVRTDVGAIAVDVGDAERAERDLDTTGGTSRTRSAGFASASIQVTVELSTDVGSVGFITR